MNSIIITPSDKEELKLLLMLLAHLKIESKVLDSKELEKLSNPNKGVDALKYCGTVKFSGHPLDLQNKWRNDWR